jgi:hypothetical protein
LAAIYINVFFVHFLSQCSHGGKNVKKYIRRASVELWKAKVPHSTIRSQLKMFSHPEEDPVLSK